MSGALTRLDKVCEIVMGQAPPGDSYNTDEGWPLIAGPGDFGLGGLAPKKYTTKPSKTSQPGDIILGIRASIGDKVLSDGTYCLGRGVAGLRANADVDMRYLWHWLSLASPQLASKGRGATFKQVSREDIGGLLIPLVQLEEQRRIGALLDRADGLRAKRRQALAHLDDLARAIYVDMFGNPMENDHSWPVFTIGDVVARFESGKNVVADDENQETQYRVLKVSAITSLIFLADESKPAPDGYLPPPSHIVREGDLLFSRANTTELIGATAIARRVPDNMLLPDKIWRFVWHEQPKADPTFVCHLFQQPAFRREISRRATGTSGSMKNISQEKVLSIRCGMPPIELQRSFATRAARIQATKDAQQAQLAELDALYAALRDRAFAGEL